MIKWLFLLSGAAFLYFWLKGNQLKTARKEMQSQSNSKTKAKISAPEVMVQCQCCKVHLPQSEAIPREDRFYCSKEHINQLDEQGWLGNASWCFSPNYDLRPNKVNPELVVLHHISLPPGEFQKRPCTHFIVDFFQNKLDPSVDAYFREIADQKVSSHFLISRAGEIFQFVSTQNKAWHAGVSSFLGREKCNDFSIGIELEGDGECEFEEDQYQALQILISQLCIQYPNLQFAGHSDIAPHRKTDPGIQFDWKKFQKKSGLSVEKFPYGLNSR